MIAAPRIPYGLAKWIVRHMRHGEMRYVRPRYIISFRKAAREEGVYIISNTVRRRGRALWRVMRVADGHASGHVGQRMPAREPITGKFLRDPEAVEHLR